MSVDVVPYAVVAAVAIAAPGPDFAVMVRNATRGGRREVFATGAGVTTGFLVHATAAAIGLGAVLAASATAYTAVKLLGAAYLVVLGVQALVSAWRGARPRPAGADRAPLTVARAYRQGLLVNVLNPKVVLTFLALMPQFLPHDASLAQRLLLSAVTVAIAAAWFAVVAAVISAMRRALERPRVARSIDAVSGVVLVALGTRVAVAPSR